MMMCQMGIVPIFEGEMERETDGEWDGTWDSGMEMVALPRLRDKAASKTCRKEEARSFFGTQTIHVEFS